MIGLQRNANEAQEFICLMDIADKKQALLRRAGENELKAQLASDPRVKQTFLDLAEAYRSKAHDMEVLFSLRERARVVSRVTRKNT